jgi:hypothetical protein
MKGLALAYGTPARPREAFAFVEDEAAFGTLRGLDDKALAGPVKGVPNMFQVVGNLLLGNTHQPGKITGGKRSLLQFRHDQVTDRVVQFPGASWPVTEFIAILAHNEVYSFLHRMQCLSGPADDRNIYTGRLDKLQRSATICIRTIPNRKVVLPHCLSSLCM